MADQAVGDIIKNITDEVKILVRDEMELAKSELIPSARNAGIGGSGAAGYFAICARSLVTSPPPRSRWSACLAGLPDRGVALFVIAGDLWVWPATS
jgi:hypothetical protein